MKRIIALFAAILLIAVSFSAVAENTKIIVGATPVPHAVILEAAKALLLEKGIELEIQEFTDYILPNLALENGDLNANYYQHAPYLTNFNENNNTHLVGVAQIHYEPMGIYGGKTKSFEELADGATVAIPNDTTNEARALLLLQAQGLIKLPENSGLDVTVADIVENPKGLVITELEAAQIPRTLPDFDIAVINGNYALEAGLNAATDALLSEASDSLAAETFANLLVVKEGEEENPAILTLIEVLQSQELFDFITSEFEGAVVPKFEVKAE